MCACVRVYVCVRACVRACVCVCVCVWHSQQEGEGSWLRCRRRQGLVFLVVYPATFCCFVFTCLIALNLCFWFFQRDPGLSSLFDVTQVYLTAPRWLLFQRIDQRCEHIVDAGLVEETLGYVSIVRCLPCR